jgi:hypothetical protein
VVSVAVIHVGAVSHAGKNLSRQDSCSVSMFGPHMSANFFYAKTSRGTSRWSSTLPGPKVSRGTLVTGRIVNLLIGQCHGFIRLPNAREIYFHRGSAGGHGVQ